MAAMIDIGQLLICDLFLRLDTYVGCSHNCQYCFATRKNHNKNEAPNIKSVFSKDQLIRFLNSRPGNMLYPFKDYPFHWGGMSDPFQPIEKIERQSLQCMKILLEHGKPFVVSTKGKLIADKEYLSILSKCNAAVQISMACPSYDAIEPGAPTYNERLKVLEAVSKNCKRSIVRIQPYIPQFKAQIISNLKRIKDAGCYGIIVEAIKYYHKAPNTVSLGGVEKLVPKDQLIKHFLEIRQAAHTLGLKFFSGENRLRHLGDDLCCCGVSDLPGFKTNKYNANHYYNGDVMRPDACLCDENSKKAAYRLIQSSQQEAGYTSEVFKNMTLKQAIDCLIRNKNNYFKKVFGLTKERPPKKS